MDGKVRFPRKKNHRERANVLSKLFFCYTLPTFIKGFKRDLEVSDLNEPLKEHKSSKLGDKIEAAWIREEERAKAADRTPSLGKVLLRVFGWEFSLYGIVIAISELAVKLPQPIILGQFLRYYVPGQTEITLSEAYLSAAGVVGCSLLSVILTHPYIMGVLHLGMKIRVACCSLIYRKALRLSQSSLGETSVGQMVNLLSNDVNRFDTCSIHVHQLWAGPLQAVCLTYLLYLEVGISAVYGILTLLLFIPIQIFLGKRTSVLRLRIALSTDRRIRLMHEIISGIQVIKMYTWEKPFAKLVEAARKREINFLRHTSYVRGVIISFKMFLSKISIFICILAYVLYGNELTPKKVFIVTSFYNLLKKSIANQLPQGIAQVAEAMVSVGRINTFLVKEENCLLNDTSDKSFKNKSLKDKSLKDKSLKDKSLKDKSFKDKSLKDKSLKDKSFKDKSHTDTFSKEGGGVILDDVSAKWQSDSTENTLNNLTIAFERGKLVAIIGPVGSGKSSLLQAVLKELPLVSGNIRVDGLVSYSSQVPWLFAASIRHNILFGLPADEKRYKNVLRVCALERDLEALPFGDETVVGERGVSLSGGQRARINLARAVYKKADVYLLDDPLSAVDAHVGKQLFDECIVDFLGGKTVVLVTHQLQYLKRVERIAILENGTMRALGTYRELRSSDVEYARELQRQDSKEDVEKNREGKENGDREENKDTMYNGDVKNLHVKNGDVKNEDVKLISNGSKQVQKSVEESKSSGSVTGQVYKVYFKAGGPLFVLFVLSLLFVLSQIASSGGDYFITYWVNMEQSMYNGTIANETGTTTGTTIGTTTGITTETTTGTASGTASTGTTTTGTTWVLDRDSCLFIFSAIIAATILITIVRSFMFFAFAMRASVNLHNVMFENVIRAKMWFFNNNPSGRILNRFSKDIGSVDELLPSSLIDVLQTCLSLVGVIVIVCLVNPWLVLPTLFITVVLYYIRKFYVTTSRSLKRLEGVTRSPVFSHISASLEGLTTIRAFKAEEILKGEFDAHQDLHSSAWFEFLSTSRAFGLWLDLVSILYIAVITFSFLVLGTETYGGNVGLAVTQAISLTGMFQWGMRQSAELENYMTSVERILEYSTQLPQEPPLESKPNKKPRPDWPQRGTIRFVRVTLSYDLLTKEPVLKDLSFSVNSKEKIGVVGRTGAGKTSLITALFRLAEVRGQIIIDGVDTSEIGLHDLRSKISIIPQEPVLFSGTMRKNLDPFDEYEDAALWRALEDVRLKEVVEESAAGLLSPVSEGGSNFSVGQRQLVCLARAIVRKNNILILDEATANVDPTTDALIQTTIRKKFRECTVVTIAHRLLTVMDSDRILVIEGGAVLEFDAPHVLLGKEGGLLYGMVQESGRSTAEQLKYVAQTYFKKEQQ